MNRDGHLIWSEFILICFLTTFLAILLLEYGAWDVLVAAGWSIGLFLNGCLLPDWDHHKVQKKLIILRPLGRITKHRGHWHSLSAMAIYGFIILFIMYVFKVKYWYFPVAFGMIGFFSHLLEDQIKTFINGHSSNTIKLW